MKKPHRQLCQLLALIETPQEADLLLQDLLTPQEREVLAERWQIIQELAKGTPQRKIAQKLKIGIATVTRGSLAYQHQGKGFDHFLKKFQGVTD